MDWRVTFPQPVIYQPGHPLWARTITELIVMAPTAEGARIHAIRTCSGDGLGLLVAPVAGPLAAPPPPEWVPDRTISIVAG